MDARIEVQCRTCGRVEVRPADIDLVVDAGTDAATYGFTCPRCASTVRRSANGTVVRMLELGGVSAHGPRHHPERVDDAVASLPPLTVDDLLDLHALLGTDDWFRTLADR